MRELLKKTKRPAKAEFAGAPGLFDNEAKGHSSLKNRIRGLERLLKKVRVQHGWFLLA